MKRIRIKLVCYFFLFCCIIAVAQSPDKITMQLSSGNNYFINPSPSIFYVAPACELNFFKMSDDEETSKISRGLFFGLNYNYASQDYKVSQNQKTPYTASSNEYLFNLGGALKIGNEYNFFTFCLFGQMGPTYSKSDEPYFSNSIQLGFNGQRQNSHEFLQFYASTMAFYGFEWSKKICILIGIKGRFFIGENDLSDMGMIGTNIKYNYAPFKFNPFLGLQVGIGK